MFNRAFVAIRHNLVAWLALLVALGGTSLAATHYVITSTKQIKPSVLKQLEGKSGPTGTRGGPVGARAFALVNPICKTCLIPIPYSGPLDGHSRNVRLGYPRGGGLKGSGAFGSAAGSTLQRRSWCRA